MNSYAQTFAATLSLLITAAGGIGGCDDKEAPIVSATPPTDAPEREGKTPPPEVPASGALPAQEPGAKRYEISHGKRLLGIAVQADDGKLSFTPDADLPSPCLADDLKAKWEAHVPPKTIRIDTGGVKEDGTRWRGAVEVDKGTEAYPYAVLIGFLSGGLTSDPRVPRPDRFDKIPAAERPTRFEVSARNVRGETPPENFTKLPLGTFVIAGDGAITLETACEGDYLAGRLAKHFAQDEIELSFAEPSGKSALLKPREPGDLRLTVAKSADVKLSYRRGEPEFFAALMTVVDHQFYVNLDVKPAPVLAASSLGR